MDKVKLLRDELEHQKIRYRNLARSAGNAGLKTTKDANELLEAHCESLILFIDNKCTDKKTK